MAVRFYNPTRIEYGSGVLSRLDEIVSRDFSASRIMLITDRGVRRTGFFERVSAMLPAVEVFDAVEPNPRHSTVNRAGKRARELDAQLVIGLGGGSALDAAKAVALLAANPGCIEDYEGRGRYGTPPRPLVAVPTTCGTGSEVTWVAVITHSERRFKMSVKGPAMFPAVALVDPDLLISLPPPLVASTGMDALTHAIEAYSVRPASFITDVYAREAVALGFRFLERAFRGIRNDHEARDGVMKASLLAGLAFGNSDVGGVHCISESIGALFDTPHGVANAVFLPHVMTFNLPEAAGRYAELGRTLGLKGANDLETARAFIGTIADLSRSLRIPRFRDLQIPEDRFPEIADNSYANNSNPSNPRPASASDYLGILENAWRAE